MWIFLKDFKTKVLILIILSFLVPIISDDEQSTLPVNFPTFLTLLNQNIAMAADDGIYFFNAGLTEDTTKKITFNDGQKINNEDEYAKTTMVQFSEKDGGYIMILVKDILYIFDADGNKITSFDFSSSINAKHYCLIPYKKNNNYLHYVLTYPTSDFTFF